MRAVAASLLACAAVALSLVTSDTATGADAGWHYVLPVDHGIRADRGGKGHFLASRTHGKHNGLDLIAPIGTPLLAACHGKARGGKRGGFGNYVHLVCRLPSSLVGSEQLYASLFYAHMRRKDVPHRKWIDVSAGQRLGEVGKTGNATSASIMPHVHFEVIVHGSERAAMDERHSGRDQADTDATDALLAALDRHCLAPMAFSSALALRRARRLDPFVLMTCLEVHKPGYQLPDAPLTPAARRWSSHYDADGFDVDVGIRNE